MPPPHAAATRAAGWHAHFASRRVQGAETTVR